MQDFKRYGQASLEYLIVIGISLLLLTPVILMGGNSVVDLKHTTDEVTARDAVDKVADMARIVYAQGKPAKITEQIRIPDNVDYVTISDGTILMRMSHGSDIYEMMDFNVSGALTNVQGFYDVQVLAMDNVVNISIVS